MEYDIFGKKSGNKVDFLDYLNNLRKSYFVISTTGDRDDCFRHCECIGLDSIPISNISTNYREIYEDNMIYSNAPEMINMLNNEKEITYTIPNKDILTIEYWKNKIFKRLEKINDNTDIYSLIKNRTNYIIDIGASSCSKNDPLYKFIINNEFKGLCIEGNKDNIIKLKEGIANTFQIYDNYIYPDNIIEVFEQFNVPIEIDILKIDIDGFDLEIIRTILTKYKPKIIIAKYNEKIPPPILFETKFKKNYAWDYSHCFGFSISSGEKVMDENNYTIVKILELNNIICVQNEICHQLNISKNNIQDIYNKEYKLNLDRLKILPWNENVNYWLNINDNYKLYNEILNYFTKNNNRSIFENKNKNKILDIDFILEIGNNIDTLFKELGTIEKKIHVSWKNKDIIDLDYNIIKNGIFNLKHLNPDYNFEISDDNDIDMYLKLNLKESDYLLIKNRHIVEKTDLWRLFKIYNEGGIYMDIDRLCNISFSSILNNKNIKCVIPTYKDMDFSQDIMISCSKNPFHKKAIELNLQRRKEGITSIVYLGPDTYLHAISELLLGYQVIRQENNNEYMNIMRKLINYSKYLYTYREDPPFQTFLYNGPYILFDKDLFYKNQNVTFHPS